ncbi:MAG: peptide chain release factor 2 [Desulfobacterium sp.]|nr:peptide chain release factor 2 [Desulfobacterium sp.]
MSTELKQSIAGFYEKAEQLKEYLDLPVKRNRLRELESMTGQEEFWNDPDRATTLLKERTRVSDLIDTWDGIFEEIEDAETLLELAHEEGDKETEQEVARQLGELEARVKTFSVAIMLDGEDDDKNAIVSINAGAGGTDSQDWTEMLYRMYSRWVDKKGFKFQMIDFQPGDEAGVKGVTFSVSGEYSYGLLKVESGVHRLVRISPFNANGKRQTSFASVFVYPELKDEIRVEIDDKDLRIDVFRASGAGGQHVNKTSSAVRITHLPSGVVAQCQQEPSQHRNKEIAMKVLQSRLYQIEKEKLNRKMQDLHDGKDDIAWGSQIRSYVLHPYRMVKDHRTDFEMGDVDKVLDGGIDRFIEETLISGKVK